MQPPTSGSRSRLARSLALTGFFVLLSALAARFFASNDPMPVWSGNPFIAPVPIVGLTPGLAVCCDAAILAGATLLLCGASLLAPLRPAQSCGMGALLVIGAVGMGPGPQPTPESLSAAAVWLSSIAAGSACFAAARVPWLRPLVLAGLASLAAPLVLRGVVQVFIEHPDTLRMFHERKLEILASHGWSEDSPMARAYERRLSQPEASGWFGMANVFAAVCAASASLLLSTSFAEVCGQRHPEPVRLSRVLPPLAVGGLVAACGVYLAGSKGGYAALALGLVCGIAGSIALRTGRALPRWTLAMLGPGAVVGVLGAVIARGLLGERVGELSLLFRWFYLETAFDIWTKHPFLGVGLGNFKEAYMLAKPAISPEDVSSPHSLFADLLSTTGLFGAAWSLLILWWLTGFGRTLLGGKEARSSESLTRPWRTDVFLVGTALAVGTVAGTYSEIVLASAESAGVRIVGLVVMLGVVGGLLAIRQSRALPVGLAAGAIAAAAHAQIELTGVTPGAATWLLCIIGLAGGWCGPDSPSSADAAPQRPRGGSFSALPLAHAALIPLVFVFTRTASLIEWDLQLRRAAKEIEPATAFTLRILDASEDRAALDSLRAEMATYLRVPPAPLDVLLDAVRARTADQALPFLERARRAQPHDLQTTQAIAQAYLTIGSPAAVDSALRAARQFAQDHPTAAALGWLGTLEEGAGRHQAKSEGLEAAIGAWEQAAKLAPHAVLYPQQLARAYRDMNEPSRASRWAQAALLNDANCRLDPLAGLSPTAKAEMEAIVKAGTTSVGKPEQTPGGP